MIPALFVLGAIIGSFLNVCIYRIPIGRSIAFPGSHCTACSRPVRWHDNLPILSFFILRGKCRDCGARFSWQYPLVEFLSGCLTVILFFKFGYSPAFFYCLLFVFALLVQSFIDLKYRIIPDVITIPGIFLGLLGAALFPQVHSETVWFKSLLVSALGFLVGGGILYLIGTIGEWVLKRPAMGGGDVKLLAMIGVFVGWQGVLWTLFAGSLTGSIAGIYFRLSDKEAEIPFGPFLAIGALSYFFSGPVIAWYANTLLIR